MPIHSSLFHDTSAVGFLIGGRHFSFFFFKLTGFWGQEPKANFWVGHEKSSQSEWSELPSSPPPPPFSLRMLRWRCTPFFFLLLLELLPFVRSSMFHPKHDFWFNRDIVRSDWTKSANSWPVFQKTKMKNEIKIQRNWTKEPRNSAEEKTNAKAKSVQVDEIRASQTSTVPRGGAYQARTSCRRRRPHPNPILTLINDPRYWDRIQHSRTKENVYKYILSIYYKN